MLTAPKYTNGSVAATAKVPYGTKVITGKSLAHRRLSKQQRAVVVADILDGMARYVPTQKELAAVLGVSVAYVNAARKLSLDKREAVVRGYDVGFPALANPPRQLTLTAPKPVVDLGHLTDSDLTHIVRIAGVERTLAAAVAVEHA